MKSVLRAAAGIWLTVLPAVAGPATVLPCARCHFTETAQFEKSGMANALIPAAEAEILKTHSRLTFRQGTFSYSIERRGNQSWYAVSDGKNTISEPIDWAFGLGAAGQTYLFRHNTAWYQSRVSYYREIARLDLTVGARPDVPGSIEEAVGRWLTVQGTDECFQCHATNALRDGTLHADTLTPGVQCQRCHADASLAGSQQSHDPKALPHQLSQLTTEELSDFCGQCHRTWAQIASDGPYNINNVRFQPYRLTNSKCYDAVDRRIRCTACHDPHSDVVHSLNFYDLRCLACHSRQTGEEKGPKVCKVASQNCVSCHMPKIRISGAHNAFTDHWIRVVKRGDPYPI